MTKVKSDHELAEVAERLTIATSDWDNVSSGEMAHRIMEVIRDLTGADLPRLEKIFRMKAAECRARANALKALAPLQPKQGQ